MTFGCEDPKSRSCKTQGGGVCSGPAGFVLLDVDVKNGETGLEDLAHLAEELGRYPKR